MFLLFFIIFKCSMHIKVTSVYRKSSGLRSAARWAASADGVSTRAWQSVLAAWGILFAGTCRVPVSSPTLW